MAACLPSSHSRHDALQGNCRLMARQGRYEISLHECQGTEALCRMRCWNHMKAPPFLAPSHKVNVIRPTSRIRCQV